MRNILKNYAIKIFIIFINYLFYAKNKICQNRSCVTFWKIPVINIYGVTESKIIFNLQEVKE